MAEAPVTLPDADGRYPIEEQVNVGFEKDRLGGNPSSLDIRWWFYIQMPGDKLRNQRARLGVSDNGFTFARGGRCRTVAEAHDRLAEAQAEAETEQAYWTGQPSHALGPSGELIPLGDIPLGLPT